MNSVFTGTWGSYHIQGIAIDQKKGYMYYSFTTKLIKATLDGEIVGTVDGLLGHLGCIAFNEEDGRVYGSIEYLNDEIGKMVMDAVGSDAKFETGFYIAIFDVDKITRPDMDAEKDGIVTTVYLKEVVDYVEGTGKNSKGEVVPHQYGCSGIDGVTFGPLCGEAPDSKKYLYVCCCSYGDVTRDDNDYQLIHIYDTTNWKEYEKPICQTNMHTSGPKEAFKKYFVFTGNTTYGVQNIEYDSYTNSFLLAVYKGKKPEYPNYSLFAVDAKIAPKREKLKGLNEDGDVLTLLDAGKIHEETGIRGWDFPRGSTGIYAWGDGTYTISESRIAKTGQCSLLVKYVWDEVHPFILDA